MNKVVVTEPIHIAPEAIKTLETLGPIQFGPFERADLLTSLSDTEILMVRLSHHIDEEVCAAAPHLQAIVSATTGINHIDITACAARNVKVITLQGETEFLNKISSTAEHTFGLIFALIRQTVSAHQQVLKHGFARNGRTGQELSGKTLGIIGYGRLGRKVASYGKCFGMNIIVNDPNVNSNDTSFVDKTTLLRSADVISLHASHKTGQEPILNAHSFSEMKSNAILINTARGELIDETALLNALNNNKINGAALDVANNETQRPTPDPLISYAKNHENLLLTPHLGGATIEALHKAEVFAVNKLLTFLNNKK